MGSSGLDLATARGRVQSLLADSGAVVWSTDTLDEGLRQALGDIGRAAGGRLTLAGLDGSSATSLDARDEDLLVRGAGGYAARSRAADRAEMVSVVLPAQPAGLAEWGERVLEDFREGVEGVRRRGLQESRVGPVGRWE